MQKRKILFVVIAIVFFGFALAYSADLKTLMEIGASQADIAKTLQQETKVYNSIKKAIAAGALKAGVAADSIRKKYGGPVVEIYDKKHDANKWLYMPATSSHFKGEKAYLYFDKENKLKEWEQVEN